MSGPESDVEEPGFKKKPITVAGFSAEFSREERGANREYVILKEFGSDGDLRLYVSEARALRDWLNEVLP